MATTANQGNPTPGKPLRQAQEKDLPHTSQDSDEQDDDQTQRNAQSQGQEASQPGLTGHINVDGSENLKPDRHNETRDDETESGFKRQDSGQSALDE